MQTASDVSPIVAFDAVIFIQATLRSQGPAYAALLACREGRARLLVTDEILAEVRDVLGRPELRAKNVALTDTSTAEMMSLITEASAIMDPAPRLFTLTRDRKDEPYINLAIAAGADYLVSRDKDLLDLMDESAPEGKDFRARFPGLTIVEPVSFLRALEELP